MTETSLRTHPLVNLVEAALYLAPVLGRDTMRDLIERTDLNSDKDGYTAFKVVRAGSGRLTLTVSEHVDLLASPYERREIWLSALIRLHHLRFTTSMVELRALCKSIGVYSGNLLSPAERWRHIYAQGAPFSPSMEDRPLCGLCCRPVASDSKTNPNAYSIVHQSCVEFVRQQLHPAPRPEPKDNTLGDLD